MLTHYLYQGSHRLEKYWNFGLRLEKCWDLIFALKITIFLEKYLNFGPETGEELGKRKRTLDLLDELKAKRGRLSSSIEHLQKSEVTLYNKAEATGKVSFVVEANSIRKGREQKQTELKGLESEISEVVKTLST